MAVTDELFITHGDQFAAEVQMMAMDVATSSEMNPDMLRVAERLGRLASVALAMRELAGTATESTIAVEAQPQESTTLSLATTVVPETLVETVAADKTDVVVDDELPPLYPVPSAIKTPSCVRSGTPEVQRGETLTDRIAAYLEAHAGQMITPATLRSLDTRGGNTAAISQRFRTALTAIRKDPRYASRFVATGNTSSLRYGLRSSAAGTEAPPIPHNLAAQPQTLAPSAATLATNASKQPYPEKAANIAEIERVYGERIIALFQANPNTLLKLANFADLDPNPSSLYEERSNRFRKVLRTVMGDPAYAERIKRTGEKSATRYWFTENAADETVPRAQLPVDTERRGSASTPIRRAVPSWGVPTTPTPRAARLVTPPKLAVVPPSERVDVTPEWNVALNPDGTGTLDGTKITYTLALDIIQRVVANEDGLSFDELRAQINANRSNRIEPDSIFKALKYIQAFLPKRHAEQWSDEFIQPDDPAEVPDRILKIVRPDTNESEGTDSHFLAVSPAGAQQELQIVPSGVQGEAYRDQPRDSRTTWMLGAACVGMDVKGFFPVSKSHVGEIAVCSECPVIDACLDFGMSHEQKNTTYGIYGGLFEGQRSEVNELFSAGDDQAAINKIMAFRKFNTHRLKLGDAYRRPYIKRQEA